MSDCGVWLPEPDQAIEAGARRARVRVHVGESDGLPYPRTLIAGPGARVPWELLPAGFEFLTAWECAAPLWRYGVLAADAGDSAERAITEALLHDLRLPLYASELLYVRDCDGGRALIAAWAEERERGPEVRLAFMRALYRVKPLFLALPVGWAQAPAALGRPTRPARRTPAVELVHVELAPGHYVCCKPSEVERYRAQYMAMRERGSRLHRRESC